ncbi:PQQ-binding-like beta-propeller repeat protein, partial [bacterium]|nr:PQQ-binding-like beta-propeller repeat protein [bacterium]
MSSLRLRLAAAVVVSVGLGLVATAMGDDWPAYRHDLARSGVTKENLPTPLHRQWVYVAAHPPRPAWPEPGRELNRVAFDYSFGVTAAEGRLYFGSSADHTVRCLDLATGKERWRFFTGGPVRFAPTLAEGRVLVGSDDGWLYCLAAADGKVLWRFHAAPSDEMLLGNGQMISRWPLRTGVGVEKGIAYFAAGMWPSEGVYVYAVRIQDGSVVWKNDTSGTQYLKQPHPGSFSMTGVAPQGYVLAQGEQVFVPTGRNVPAAYDRATGKLLYYRSAPSGWGNRWGGGWNFLVDGMLIGWTCHIGPDINVLDGEYDADPKDGLVVYDAATGKEKREAAGKLCAVASKGILYASGSGSVTAYDLKAWVGRAKEKDSTKWDTPHSRAYAMILAGNTLAIGGQGMVTTLDATNGKQSWYDKVDGQARTLAVADGRLLVSTSEGQIVCYAPDAPTRPTTINRRETPPAARPDIATVVQARSILEKAAKKEGFCLVLGTGKPGFLQALAAASTLTIMCLEPDAGKVAAARQALAAARLYGTRVVVHHGSPASLPYPDYFADLILATSDSADLLEKCAAADVYRVLRPLGGRLFVETPKPAGGVAGSIGRGLGIGHVTPRWVTRWLANGGVPADETSTAGSVVQVVRGAVPESDDWTHQYATPARTGASNDRSARLPLKLLWFGEPGPAPLVARHWGGPSPLCVKGRMFVIGERCLIAVDAYNGHELWRRDFPGVAWWPVRVRGNSVAADDDSVYLVQGKQCLRLDAATGDTLATYDMPPAPAEVDPARVPSFRWSYLATGHDRVLGAMGTDRESKCLFVLAKDGKPRWTFAAHGTVSNNAASMDDRRVYLIDQTSAAEVARAKRRGKTLPAKTRLVALDASTGAVAWQATDGISGRSELWLADGILVATSRSGMTGFDAATGKTLYTRNAASGRFPVITDGSIYAEPFGFDLRTGKRKTRPNPLTGKQAPWDFRRSYGCGSISGSPNMLLFRSGTLGMYDLAGDSGVHNFGGVRAGCYVNAIVANGVVLCPPGDATCTCSYSLRTTVALISAGDKEHWSIFYDRLPNASVTKAALNLGAPGDRRDPSGTIWLGVPRPDTRSDRPDAAMPFRLEFHDGGGPYQRSLAGLSIAKTDLPWVYANGVQGIRKATLDLEILDTGIVAWPAARTPRIDGILAEPCWDDYHAVVAPGGAAVSVRYDDAHLYLAYERPAATDGKGAPQPWKAAVKDADGPVWKDDSFNIILSPLPRAAGQPSPRCVHLGVSASGARYDAAWQFVSPFPVLDIPKHAVKVDGKADDWADAGLHVLSLTSSKGQM